MRCEECGYDYDEVARVEIAPRVRTFGARYEELLARGSDAALRNRPSREVWSPLEYACHVRDVFDTQSARIARALEEDTPVFTPMGRDELPIERRYNEQDPTAVAGELSVAADRLAQAFESLDDAGWARTGVYTYPTREVRTIEWVGRHTIHEGEHHLMDIERQLPSG
jgi:hypothetical protein